MNSFTHDHSDAKNAFLNRVRQATVKGRSFRVTTPDSFPDQLAYVGASPSSFLCLKRELESVGAKVYCVSGKTEVQDCLNRVLEKTKPQSVLSWTHPVIDKYEIRSLLRERHVTLCSPDDQDTDRRFKADMGISSVDWAIAETGSLIVCSKPEQPTDVSLLPPIHLALVEEAQILPDIFDLFTLLPPQGLPSNLGFITGPSKTGDIELKLTTGVHGPKELLVVLIESSPSSP